MAKIDVKIPKVLTIEYHQDKEDKDYGSCLWARFKFDLDNYELNISSDCGDYGYGWIPTPDKESFIHLMSRVNGDYLLEKLSDRSVVDGGSTSANLHEILLELDVDDFIYEDIDELCEAYSDFDETFNALTNALSDVKGIDSYDVYECIEMDYPPQAKKIVEIFISYIKATLQEMDV